MKLIKTSNFELAIYDNGDKNASKIAIVIPGRLDSKDYVHITSLVDTLAERGYYAISFDPPGTWQSPGDIRDYTTTTYINVINELIEHFGNKPTLLLGHSRGGSVAMLASSNPFVLGLVAIMATYGAPSTPSAEAIQIGYQVAYRDLPPGTSKTKEQKKFELPINYFIDGERYNPTESLQKFTKPKLLIYGDEDEFTKSQTVEAVYRTLLNPKMIKKVHSVHDYRLRPDVIEEINATIDRFLQSQE